MKMSGILFFVIRPKKAFRGQRRILFWGEEKRIFTGKLFELCKLIN